MDGAVDAGAAGACQHHVTPRPAAATPRRRRWPRTNSAKCTPIDIAHHRQTSISCRTAAVAQTLLLAARRACQRLSERRPPPCHLGFHGTPSRCREDPAGVAPADCVRRGLRRARLGGATERTRCGIAVAGAERQPE